MKNAPRDGALITISWRHDKGERRWTLTGPGRNILIAHRSRPVCERFAAALSDAHHHTTVAESSAGVLSSLTEVDRRPDMALVDLGLSEDAVTFARAIRQRTSRSFPIVVFAGSVTSAATAAALGAVNVGYVNEHVQAPLILPALSPHLFPDSFNRRASARIAIGVPVSYRSGQTIAGAVTLDIGKGGVTIRTMEPLARGAAVQVKFSLPGVPDEIEASSRVVWTDRRVGMGIRFEQVSSNDQRAIDAFVEASITVNPVDLSRRPGL